MSGEIFSDRGFAGLIAIAKMRQLFYAAKMRQLFYAANMGSKMPQKYTLLNKHKHF